MTASVPVRTYQGLAIIPQDRWMLRVQAVFGCVAFGAIGIASAIAGGLAAVAGIAYGATLALSSVASFVYNSRFRHRRGETIADRWRLLDHSAIFLLIAGTYTPFGLLVLSEGLQQLILVWSLALTGVLLKFIVRFRFQGAFRLLYLATGWSVAIGMDRALAEIEPTPMALLVAGGIAYTTGVVFHLRTSWKWYSAIWHAFVLLASILHFGAVWATIGARV
jgi:hemolysin III